MPVGVHQHCGRPGCGAEHLLGEPVEFADRVIQRRRPGQPELSSGSAASSPGSGSRCAWTTARWPSLTTLGCCCARCPVPSPAGRDGLRGARRAAALSSGPAGPITGQRRVSSRGGVQVVRQKIQVGVIQAGKAVTVLAGDDTFRLVIDGETVAVAARAASSEIHRYKAYATHRGRR